VLDFLGGGWGWKNLGDVGSVVCMLPKLRCADVACHVRKADGLSTYGCRDHANATTSI